MKGPRKSHVRLMLLLLIIILNMLEPASAQGPEETFVSEICTPEQQRNILPTMLGCSLREEIVELDLPDDSYIHVVPRHVAVRRCRGSCYSRHHTCLPTTTRKKTVNVLLVPYSAAAGSNPSVCATTEVVEHTSCGCSCKTKPEDCTAGLQSFSASECRCVCANSEARGECLAKGWHWSQQLCQCMCQDPSTFPRCSSGYHFDPYHTCSCMNFSEYASPILEVIVLILVFSVGIITLSLVQCYKNGIGVFQNSGPNLRNMNPSREQNATELRTIFRALSSGSQPNHRNWMGYSHIRDPTHSAGSSAGTATSGPNQEQLLEAHSSTNIIRNPKTVPIKLDSVAEEIT